MALFQKKATKDNPMVAVIETELATTRRKREDLVTRRDKLAYALGEAEAGRRDALLLDDNDESAVALAKAASSVESHRSSLQGVDLLLAEHDARIVDLETQIKTGKSRAERERQAQALEQKLNRARDAFPKYIAAAQGLAEAMGGTGNFHLEEASALIARVARDVDAAKETLFRNGDRAVSQLRADPPPKPAPIQPPPPGPFSPFRKHFMAEDGSMMTDAGPVYCGFPERD